MANAEQQLIARVVRTGDLAAVLSWGITEDDFQAPEAKGIWRWIAGYYMSNPTAGSVIGPLVYANNFNYIPLGADDPGMTTDALCYELRSKRLVAEAKHAAVQLTEQVEMEPAVAIAATQSHLQRLLALGDRKNNDVFFEDAMQRIRLQYEAKKANKFAFARLTWPWQVLNDHTGGVQIDDYVVLYGRPKSGKTWILALIIAHAFMTGKPIVLYTKEMTPDNIYQRMLACLGEIPYKELRGGGLLPEDEEKLAFVERMARDKFSHPNLICLDGRSAGAGGDTVPWLAAKVEQYKPAVMFIDGIYLLSDARSKKSTVDWQRVTNISRDIREMILYTKTPVIGTMQANRSASKHQDGDMAEIAYADAVGQDATMAMRVINEKKKGTMACVVAGSREFSLHGFRLNNKPAVDFSFHSEMTEEDVDEAKSSDAPVDPKNAKKTKREPKTKAEAAIADATKSKEQEQRELVHRIASA